MTVSFNVHLFGASTVVGTAFLDSLRSTEPDCEIFIHTRKPEQFLSHSYYLDLLDHRTFSCFSEVETPSVWLSFAPIWLFASFLENLSVARPHLFRYVRAIICCSSTSALTKRFSFNISDQLLFKKLVSAESSVASSSSAVGVSFLIVRPTLVYGQSGMFRDRNISIILLLLRCLPFVVFPSKSGLRQPIHASQLAAVFLFLMVRFRTHFSTELLSETLEVGGDHVFSYYEMLKQIQSSHPRRDRARNCLIILLPNRIFYFLSSPLLLVSPKLYEALIRLSADLCGFTPSYKVIDSAPVSFLSLLGRSGPAR